MDELPKILTLYKKLGETPLECLKRFQTDNPAYKNLKMTYAGRLDPLAEGVLLALAGEETKNKEKYLGLDKEYEVEVLLGAGTDTGDILGVPKFSIFNFQFSKAEITKTLQNFEGTHKMPYPAYSSKTVNGKPLWMWAREGKLGQIKIPKRAINIENIKLLKITEISANKLLETIEKKISLVNGNFRQKEILATWQKLLKNKKTKFSIIKIKVLCGSGTYMRTLAEEIGKKLKTNALAFSIKRISIKNKKSTE